MLNSRPFPKNNPRISSLLDEEQKKLHESIVEVCRVHKLSYVKTSEVLRQADEKLCYEVLNSKEVW